MKLKNYIAPIVSEIQYIALTICAFSGENLNKGGQVTGGGGNDADCAPGRCLYV